MDRRSRGLTAIVKWQAAAEFCGATDVAPAGSYDRDQALDLAHGLTMAGGQARHLADNGPTCSTWSVRIDGSLLAGTIPHWLRPMMSVSSLPTVGVVGVSMSFFAWQPRLSD